jgi:acetyltransferase-like isoleucine patch superfamily enzyme
MLDSKRPLIFVGSRQKMSRLAFAAELLGIEVLGILDYHYYGNTADISGIPVIGDERWLLDDTNTQAQTWKDTCDFFPGNWWEGKQPTDKTRPDLGLLRQQRIDVLEQTKVNVINLINPLSVIENPNSQYANVNFGRGIFIDSDCWISNNFIDIGDYCSISYGTKISWHTRLGKNVCVGPNTYLYSCDIGDNSYFGMFSKIDISRSQQEKITIGKNCTVWSNCSVVKDVEDNKIYTDTNRTFKKLNV